MNNKEAYSLRRELLPSLADRLLQRHSLVAPTAISPQETLFAPVDRVDQIAWDYGNSLISPVAELFPPAEVLFEFDLSSRPPELHAPSPPAPTVLFGIRPCDATALRYLDDFFLRGDFVDSAYARRREATTLVVWACEQPASERCFCSCCEAGPVLDQGYDLQLVPVGDRVLVEVGSPQGAQMLDAARDLLEPADEWLMAKRDEQTEQLHQELSAVGNIPAAMRAVSGGSVPAECWDRLAARCMECGGCSMVCPKCTCFDVIDLYTGPQQGARLRAWDSCRLWGYSQEASGYNPRAAQADRTQRYAYHKLSHDYFQQYDAPGCVGCGRCLSVCLGGVDMEAMLAAIREAMPSGRRLSAVVGGDPTD